MSTQVQHRRGTAAQHESFTGAMSEFTHDTTNNRIHVHDGSTVGGHPTLMMSDKGIPGGLSTLDATGSVPEEQLGNVPEATDYASVADVEIAEIGEDILYLRTAGYLIPGDGDGALYKKVSIEPSHAAKIRSGDGAWWELAPDISDQNVVTPANAEDGLSSAKIKLDLRVDNPNMVVRLVSDKFRDVVSARDFGAFGMGNDYSDELQAFFNSVKPDGKRAWVPRGEYGLTSTLVLNNHETNNEAGEPIPKNMILHRTQIVGDGSGSTVFRVAGDIVGLHIASGQGKARHCGFSVVQDQSGKVGRGLLIDQTQGLQIEDIEVKGFSVGLTNRDSFSINYVSVDMIENEVGFVGENVISGSHPNALNFNSCRFIYSGSYGCLLRNPTTCNFIGGSFESNGVQGNPDHIALNVAGSSNEGAFGCNLLGVYFENNAGFSDVAFTNIGSGARVGMHRVNGCTFNRISNTRYTEHNIYVNKSASGFLRVVASENSFQGFGTYVPNASRTYILSVDGGGGAPSVIRENNLYGSAVETPV